MADHATTPWVLCHHLQSAESDASCPCGYRGGIWGADGEHIVCEIGSQPTPGQEDLEPPRYDRAVELANATIIVKAVNSYAALTTDLAQARARIAELEKALEPFSKAADHFDNYGSMALLIPKIIVRDLRRARAALAGEKREGGE